MSYPSVTNNFVAGSPARASEVNANFTDIINGISDGTKSMNVADLTCTSIIATGGANIGSTTFLDGLRIDADTTTDKIRLGVGMSTAEAGTWTRDTTRMINVVSDAGTLTDEGVLLIDSRGGSGYGIVMGGWLGWAEYAGTSRSTHFSLIYDANAGTCSATFTGPSSSVCDDDNTDGKLCVYMNATDIVIKNRLGYTIKLGYFVTAMAVYNGT